jgi:hypothetical protein
MASEVTICNQALSWLGQTPITSLEDPSTTAQLCKANYSELRQAVLEDSRWHFARMTFILDTPELIPPTEWTDYAFKFPLPPVGMLIVRDVYENRQGDVEAQWTVQGEYIYANRNPIYVVATADIEGANAMTASFRQALAARIAMDLAVPITQSRTMQEDMATMYGVKLSEAVAIDSQQGENQIKSTSRLNDVRYGSGPQ